MRGLIPLLVLGVIVGCGREQDATRFGDTPPVILISIDTLRSDRLPVYGYDAIETPAIDQFRRDAILFESAWSHYPLTLPSHASALTGELPPVHGVRDNVGFKLDEGVPTIATRLRDAGYATGGAVSAWVLRDDSGIARGFDFYDDEVSPVGESRGIGTVQRAGTETVAIGSEWIRKQTEPVFFFLHIYEPHTPWAPPERHRDAGNHPYDGEVAWSDEIIGDFLRGLKEAGLYDDALIILFSDHGEGLNDHGEKEHGLFLYREAIQVPMIVKLPGGERAGSTVSAPVALVDIARTVTDVVGVAPLGGDEAMSLLDGLEDRIPDERMIYSETYYPRFHMGWSDLQSLVEGNHHYIRAPKPELYALDDDPEEVTNLVESERRTYFRLAEAIEPYLKEATGPTSIDPEEQAKLAALGYLGSTVSTRPGEVLPDPKDKIETYKRMGRAFEAFQAEQFERVIAETGEILRENPGMVDLLDIRGKSFAKLNRWDEAIEAGRDAFERNPHAKNLALSLADYLLSAERFEEARAHAELAMEMIPSAANLTMARIDLAEEKLDSAREYAQRALAEGDAEVPANIILAKILTRAGDLQPAMRHIERAFAAHRDETPLPEMHFVRGDLLARMGHHARAEQEFRTEIENFPTNPQTYKNLILLLVDGGRLQEANRVIYELIETAPAAPSYVAIADVLSVIGDERGARYWAQRGLEKFPNDPELRRLARS